MKNVMSSIAGFTLVELSIVLVILGLLVGGVLTGQSLIRAAELRSVTTQEQRYVAAVQTFRDKYFALPGDMTNAAAYWGAADGAGGTTAACATTLGTGTQTCNGDGNGQLNYASASSNEIYRFWQHLANAGLIEGNYSGITQGSTPRSTTSANTPVGRISSSIWWAYYSGTSSGDAAAFDGQYDNFLYIGGVIPNSLPFTPIFKPEEAYNIDVKMDDGKPATGKVVIRATNGFSTCTDAANGASSTITANYLLSSSAIACGLYFRQAF